MNVLFDTVLDRTGTGSLKWDRYQNRDVIPLWVADMDFKSPQCILDALASRVDHGLFGYTLPYASVVGAVQDYLNKEHNWSVAADSLVWLPGLVPALNTACRAFTAENEAVMTCSPVYPPFLSAPLNASRQLVEVPLHIRNGRWTFDFNAMEAAMTPAVKLFLLCNPHNPVGRVFDADELAQLVDFCVRHDLILCSDEIHCDLILDETKKHIPVGRLYPELAGRLLTLMAPSKTYNVPGIACSYAIISDAGLRARFQRAMRGMITEVNAFGYAGCEAAYREGESWRLALLDYLRGNERFLRAFFAEHLPALVLHPLEATYLAWIDPSALKLQSAWRFFEEAGVGLSNGADFGAPGMLRLNFGCPRALLTHGLERMAVAVKALKSECGC
jgi:cystathionine beta-lyase